MATVFIRKGSDVFYGRFRLNKKSFMFSTGETSEKKAREKLKERMAEEKGIGSFHEMFDRAIEALQAITDESKRNEVRTDWLKRLSATQEKRIKLSDAWGLFVTSPKRKKKASAGWEKTKQSWFADFLSWVATHYPLVEYMDEVQGQRGSDIVSGYARDLSADVEKHGQNENTYNRRLQQIKEVFKVLAGEAGLTENVWNEATLHDHKAKGKRKLSESEFFTVCRAATGNLAHWFAIGMYTGMRLKDCVTLRWSEIDFETHRITHAAAKTISTNPDGKAIKMHPTLEARLAGLYVKRDPACDFVFPNEAEGYDTRRYWVSKRIQQFFLDCGIDTHKTGTGNRIVRDKKGNPIMGDDGHVETKSTGKKAVTEVGFHSLRHTVVSLLANRGVSQTVTAEIVGHTSTAMTRAYTEIDEDQIDKAIDMLPEIVFDVPAPAPKKPARKRTRKAK